MKEEVLKRIDALAAKLGAETSELWRILVQQARIEAWQNIAWTAVWGTLLVVLLYYAIKSWRMVDWHGNYDLPEQGVFWSAVVCTIGAAIVFLPSILYATSIATPLLNPEYWALQQILNTIK